MRTEHTCEECGEALEVEHHRGYGQRDLHKDIAYCKTCSVCYEVKRSVAIITFGRTPATTLKARLNAVGGSPLSVLRRGMVTESAWGRPIQNHSAAETINYMVNASRTQRIDVSFRRRGNVSNAKAELARLKFKANCAICGKTHLARTSESSFTEVKSSTSSRTSRCRHSSLNGHSSANEDN